MGRTIEVDIVSDADTKGIERAARGFDDAAVKAEYLNSRMVAIADTGDQLDRKLLETEQVVRRLGAEFRRTGDEDVYKALRKERGALAQLRAVKKEVDDLGDTAQRAARKVDNLGDQVGQAGRKALRASGEMALAQAAQGMTKLPGGTTGALVIAGTAIGTILASAIGAAIVAGVLLAVGGGVLAGGILAAVKDPGVRSAWGQFGKSLGDQLSDAASVFKTPLMNMASTLDTAFRNVMPDIRSMFATLAPLVDTFAAGFAGFVQNAMPGIKAAVEAAAPLLQILAEHMPALGAALSDFLVKLNEGLPGAERFLDLALSFAEVALPALGAAFAWLSNEFLDATNRIILIGDTLKWLAGQALDALGTIIHAAANAFGWVPGIGPQLQAAANNFDAFAAHVRAQLDALDGRRVDIYFVGHAIGTAPVQGIGEGMVSSGFGHRAAGGPVTAGVPYWVGERGPEVFVPAVSGAIVPTAAAPAGPTHVTVNVNTRGGYGTLEQVFALWFDRAVRSGQIDIITHISKTFGERAVLYTQGG